MLGHGRRSGAHARLLVKFRGSRRAKSVKIAAFSKQGRGFGGMARDVLDTVVAAETPEGILLELRPAGLSARFYAFLLDWADQVGDRLRGASIAAAFMGGFGLEASGCCSISCSSGSIPCSSSSAAPARRRARASFGHQGRDGQRFARHAGRVVHAQSAARRGLPAVSCSAPRSCRCCCGRTASGWATSRPPRSSCISRNARRR